jgi:hypothetical protein
MATDEKRTQLISRFYHNHVNIHDAVELMRDQNVSYELVQTIYDQLSEDAEKLTAERFHYYTHESEKDLKFHRVICWTSRYLIVYDAKLRDSAFHEITIIHSFNDKST